MKKLFFSLATVGVLAGSAIAADNINISGTVLPSAYVGFTSVGGQTLLGNTGQFIGVDINLADISAGGTFATITQPVHVKTNHLPGVTMTLTDGANGGNLKHATTNDTIAMSYQLMGSAYNIGTTGAIDLITGAVSLGDDTASVGNFVMTPATTTLTQLAGAYSTTLIVTIGLK